MVLNALFLSWIGNSFSLIFLILGFFPVSRSAPGENRYETQCMSIHPYLAANSSSSFPNFLRDLKYHSSDRRLRLSSLFRELTQRHRRPSRQLRHIVASGQPRIEKRTSSA
ncbi:hypothetical protein QBC37DRAFT_83746 [Rhypophila decipiens]|uniref:Uncharacterized protein n=1 Tax=Rhypophila decipiens TaxID=261697 RepID=A0AAN7B8I6_9PEZI|nr:hypothetical protein QBC37DRAFT_83746 [Rhypophila decipiens]